MNKLLEDFPMAGRTAPPTLWDGRCAHYGKEKSETEYSPRDRAHRVFDPPVLRTRINCDGKHCKVCVPKEIL